MEGEAEVTDGALLALAAEEFIDAQRLALLKVCLILRVQEIEIDVIGLQLLQLVVEDALDILCGLGHPNGHFVGQIVACAVMICQRFAQKTLGVALMIHVGGVDVVDAVGKGIVQHFLGACIVDFAGFRVDARQAHGAQPQQGDRKLVFEQARGDGHRENLRSIVVCYDW